MSRKNRIIKRRLIAGLVFAAAVAPSAAQARPDFYVPSTAAPAPAAALPSAPAVRPMPAGSRAGSQAGSQAGFQWSDAGIGAGGAALLLGAGGAVWATSQRRRKHAAVSG